jgi:hypothetical protein
MLLLLAAGAAAGAEAQDGPAPDRTPEAPAHQRKLRREWALPGRVPMDEAVAASSAGSWVRAQQAASAATAAPEMKAAQTRALPPPEATGHRHRLPSERAPEPAAPDRQAVQLAPRGEAHRRPVPTGAKAASAALQTSERAALPDCLQPEAGQEPRDGAAARALHPADLAPIESANALAPSPVCLPSSRLSGKRRAAAARARRAAQRPRVGGP